MRQNKGKPYTLTAIVAIGNALRTRGKNFLHW